jgi:hypothetical protein
MKICLKYSVIYPKVANPSYPETEREYCGSINLDNDSIPREEVCEKLFAGFGNHPDPEVTMIRWTMARTRSMSVGDVIHFENSNLYYICDTSGWFAVNKEYADSWLNHPRQYGCDMFELREWKKTNNIDHNTLS